MLEKTIQKLRTKCRVKLTKDAEEFDAEYKSETKRGDNSIQKSKEKVAALDSKEATSKRSADLEAESIVAKNVSLQARMVNNQSHCLGHSIILQTVSIVSPGYVKQKCKSRHTSPSILAPLHKAKRSAKRNTANLTGGTYGKER